MDVKKIGSFIKTLRKEKGLTQEDLAEALFVSGKTVSRWETGTSLPDLSMLQNIAEYFGVDIRELIDGARFPEERQKEEVPVEKETVQKMAEYSSKKEKRLSRRLWLFFGLFLLAAGCLAAILLLKKRNEALDREQVLTVTGTVTHYFPEDADGQELVLLCGEVTLVRIRITAGTRMPDALKEKIRAEEKPLLLAARAVWTERQQKAAQKSGKEFSYTVNELNWGGSSVDYYVDRTKWKPLLELRENYTPEQAQQDNCVVLDGGALLHGEEIWEEFLKQTAEGWPGSVRIYQMYTSQGNDYFLKELAFDGEAYSLSFYDRTGDTNEWFFSTHGYRHLKEEHYTEYQLNTTAYMLTDDLNADYGTYLSRLLSSSLLPYDPRYENFTVLFSLNHPSAGPVFIDSALTDIDGDGMAERCYLGSGDPLSGAFSFSLSVYGQKDGLRFSRIFYCPVMQLQFVHPPGGELVLQGVNEQTDPPQTHTFRILIRDGVLELEENGEYLKGK